MLSKAFVERKSVELTKKQNSIQWSIKVVVSNS